MGKGVGEGDLVFGYPSVGTAMWMLWLDALAGALIRVLKDEDLRLRLSRSALKYMKGFSWGRSAKEFMKVVRAI
jgi:glycosyltransferase involved in cell wall biosynthesis